ncbi:MAG: hypothetical protein JSU74_09870 [Candidatus Zixiibacteriota bacterium]|nr:MAG: hypothetical protein JSU74_09870 [candidate division Zixibacteria bacterium]
MKPVRILTVALIILAMASTASAFDGYRKGFVLGGGLGIGPVAKTSVDGFSGSYDKSGLAMNFLIGYAWDEQNMIVFLRDGILYSETWEVSFGGVLYFRDKINIIQGFSGVGYYHYFGPVGKSFFITAGLGAQDWTALDEDYDSNDYGAAILFGGGYEFARHVQVYGSVWFGSTSDNFYDYNHSQLMFTVSAVAF